MLYINELPNSSTLLHYILFADDTNVFSSHSSYDQLFNIVNSDLLSASDWFKVNNLSLNLSKTNYILFTTSQKQLPQNKLGITIDYIIIPKVSTSKFLWVHIDQHLKWNVHIDEIFKKLQRILELSVE